MDRKVRDQILQMLEDTSLGIQNSKQAQDETLLSACVTAIKAVAEVCRNELSAARYAHYQDIFDGMTLAFQQSREAHMTVDKLNEACDLSIELIQYVQKELKQDPEVKKEIVFLPYKAAMWDSLESIWRAAAADTEHCNAYVVPLPYCDRNPDGTAKEWHCEVNLFPKDVPVLDYRAVDLEKMHPDVIFIHNPYDDYNAATSVSSEYYSRNIKPYTDLLVYVPYFVSGDTIAEHFCQAPGVVNADKVIVESEIIKEQYERYYPGGNPPKDKFLALGSPKYDKVCNTTREDYALPEKWQKLIGDKKVILYNTSITAMLQHADKFNAKLRYVFDVFKKRDDVVLWWRPHPLLKAAMDSITPAVSAEYRQMEQQYIDEGWGIYDDTPEMDRALICTDAYYGDGSSLVQLYQKMGKLVMIQDIQRVNVNVANYQITHLAFDEDRSIWAIDLLYNILFHYQMKEKNKIIDLSGLQNKGKYESLVKIGDLIIMPPRYGQKIIIYNTIKDSFEQIELEKKYLPNNTRPDLFIDVISYKEVAICIPLEYKAIVMYDTHHKRLVYLDNWYKELKDHGIDENGILFAYRMPQPVVNGILYLPFSKRNIVLKIEIDTGYYEYLCLKGVNTGFYGGVFEKNDYWLLPYSGNSLVRYNIQSHDVRMYKFNMNGLVYHNVPFTVLESCGEQICLYRGTANQSIIINKLTGEVRTNNQYMEQCVAAIPFYGIGTLLVGTSGDIKLSSKNQYMLLDYNLLISAADKKLLYAIGVSRGMIKELCGNQEDFSLLLQSIEHSASVKCKKMVAGKEIYFRTVL